MPLNFTGDAVLGCLLGGALGDIVGGLAERGRPCLSDDTQLTLATCEAILGSGAANPETIAAAFLRWHRARAITGLGASTLKALRDLDAGAHWALSGARGERAAGNGAAMRIAPLAFVLDPFSAKDRRMIRDICRITHHHDEAYIGALAVLIAMHQAPAPGPEIDARAFLGRICQELPDSRVRDRLAETEATASFQEMAQKFGAGGYVVETVPLALVVALRMARGDFEATLDEAARVDGDADTFCAIAGQIAGTWLGSHGLERYLSGASVAPGEVDQILEIGRRFARLVESERHQEMNPERSGE